MSITLLLDLDDTLLDTNMDAFIPAYFKALSGALADLVPPEVMLPALMGGTKAMMLNTDPACYLREIFDAYFFPKLGLERDALQARIDRFYEEVFPNLGPLTHQVPAAIRLVDWAFQQGHRVAIATNPLFPLRAIQHRLSWAGLPPEKYPFALVSSYENFHFTKETVAYYPELLAQLGWPDDPVIMVGDDIEREVKPTQAAGLPVFWVRKSEDLPEISGIPMGRLETFQAWLESSDLDTLKQSFNSPAAMLACLRSTPAALATLTRALPLETWSRPPAEGEWCLTEIICHLRDVEREVNLPRLRKVLEEDNPFLPGAVTDVWVKERNSASEDGPQALLGFLAARKETLALLDGAQSGWLRPARHAIFGPTTLQELAGIMAGHDRAHIQQVWKTRGNSSIS
jgi:FMN phosphatase YigB (HAD superfamily)